MRSLSPIAAYFARSTSPSVYVGGSVESWTVAGAFGQRRFVGLTILLVLGVATVWRLASAATPSLGLRPGRSPVTTGTVTWVHAGKGYGFTNFVDLGLVKAGFFLPPGPSGVGNVCSGRTS